MRGEDFDVTIDQVAPDVGRQTVRDKYGFEVPTEKTRFDLQTLVRLYEVSRLYWGSKESLAGWGFLCISVAAIGIQAVLYHYQLDSSRDMTNDLIARKVNPF